ncbi:CaiB/BaiF CoA-transferase family protein [Bradyrhizobium sp. LHD-71]|uniref:CaiB/BaiF CoA transferase family protein n=1 Tax=Bradyrhizobium sp. LHD-71 TaxID=3072141 RepID=UPI00280D6678|nr:CaiB/BaiF CoA-transferase family protein [Bradyrhizobium sp. LHD-71]MDQ8731858.1 CaiB/BaiF CoA-transferase family protein [Bradyrhizobium sp. LHD-71]
MSDIDHGKRGGPLAGLRVLEFAGVGPTPMGTMLLADMGAEVVTLDRIEPVELGNPKVPGFDLLRRNRLVVKMDLKKAEAQACVLRLADSADILIEGFRPGVMERLGLGPDVCLERNPKLIYARTTGWGQTGPLADRAGHDLNYISLTGALHAIGREGGPPTPPLSLVGDFGGGGLYLAVGVLAALHSRQTTGLGQVIDVAMVDGALSLMTSFYGGYASGRMSLERGTNVVDGGAPYYDVYLCADGEYVSVAPIETRFRRELYEKLGLDPDILLGRDSPAERHSVKPKLAAIFLQRTRAEWCKVFEGSDACVAPVLSVAEAATHPHHVERDSLLTIAGVVQPAPAPRFVGTPSPTPSPPRRSGTDTDDVLPRWGIDTETIARLRSLEALE